MIVTDYLMQFMTTITGLKQELNLQTYYRLREEVLRVVSAMAWNKPDSAIRDSLFITTFNEYTVSRNLGPRITLTEVRTFDWNVK